MIPTAFGQVVEEVGKLIVGLSLAWVLIRMGKDLSIASAGAILGVTAGAGLALVYMVWYKRKNYPVRPYGINDIPDSRGKIMGEFLRIGIPIALGASVLSLVNLLDNGLCLNRLQEAAGFSRTEALTLYGAYGKAQTFYNLPSCFITPLTLSVVPAVTAHLVKKQNREASEIAESSLRIAAVIAMPMGVGLAVLAQPIYNVIYWGSHVAGARLLSTLGVAAFFVCMTMMGNALLQACGREKMPIVSIAVGGAVKIGINWVLVGNPNVNIYGAPIGSICSFGIICVLDYIFLSRALSRRPYSQWSAEGS
jgi:stage V sporulation protein B